MKQLRQIVTLILSVYLLVLTVMPCSDAHSKLASVSHTQVSQADDHHHDLDVCSPFCVCATCTAAIILQSGLTFEALYFDAYNASTPSFYRSITAAFYGSIWQPPQLV